MPRRGRTPKEVRHDDGTVTWRVRYRQGKTETSQTFRRKQDAQTFATLLGVDDGVKEALAWLDARQRDDDTADFATFFEHYLAHLTGVTSRTKADYRAIYRRYLSSLGPLPLTLITKAHVIGIVNDMDSELDRKSPKTIKNAVHMLASVMSLAIDEGHITRNPCRRIRLPRAQVDEEAEPRFLTHEEFAALHAEIPAHYKPLVVFLFGTGLRWSEATALQWRHVDLIAGTVRVRQAWKRIPGGFEVGPPKSEKSKRTVNAAVAALTAVAPLAGKPQAWVFTTPTGKTVSHSNFYNRIWAPAAARAGLNPRPRIHDARHTHASWLISDGATLEQVQDQLGHESILTTRGVYGALMPAMGVETGRLASQAMARALAASPTRRELL